MEFLWQEGHTAHATAKEAREETEKMLGVYKDFAENVAAVPVYAGIKSASERFPGAIETYSIEALMPDGKALQSATSHDLGQNFSKAYDITFADANQSIQHVYTTSWGMSWRMLGAVIMTHGDDRGLRIPPKLAPIEAVFVPIVRGDNTGAVEKSHEIAAALRAQGYRVRVDDRDQTPGWKYAEWEMRGVPLRIEIGPRDLENGAATVVRRDKQKGEDGAKLSVPFGELGTRLRDLLDEVHRSLFEQAKAFLESHTFAVSDRDEFFEKCRTRAGMIDIPWCGRPECEAEVKAATSATTRNTRPLQQPGARCVACGEPARVNAYFAQSY
jgi:prolyl-tRNA synthetase